MFLGRSTLPCLVALHRVQVGPFLPWIHPGRVVLPLAIGAVPAALSQLGINHSVEATLSRKTRLKRYRFDR